MAFRGCLGVCTNHHMRRLLSNYRNNEHKCAALSMTASWLCQQRDATRAVNALQCVTDEPSEKGGKHRLSSSAATQILGGVLAK